MLFNSIDFAIFFPIVFVLYWFITKKNLKLQNILILASSYFFYACWDWRFLFLLMFSTLLDYFTGIQMSKTEHKRTRQFWFWLSIGINLGFLGFFKYFNFFVTSFAEVFTFFGHPIQPWTLNIILPVGISFYTFHGLSYVIDIYQKKIKAEKNFVDYAVFVSFFPLLVAGPIERATHLLPQVKKQRVFEYSKAVDGMRQILWGLFKKIVIADNCAIIVNDIFANYEVYNASTLLIGAIFFTFQIYGDFSGYSDIALGTARLLGFELLRNFNYPYFSRDIAEFWRRWHISLTTWFRDYIYIPLGGSRVSKWKVIRNTFIIFLVSGFWHGANWTFIFWGFFHAVLFLPLILFEKNRKNIDVVAAGRKLPSIKEFFQMISTFALVAIAWIFFRAETITDAFKYIGGLFNKTIFSFNLNIVGIKKTILLILILLIAEWFQREKPHALELNNVKKSLIRWSIYIVIIFIILEFGASAQSFIYFQF